MGGVDEAGVLRRPTLAALTWYVSVCGGLVLVVLALLRLPPEAVADMGWPLFVIAAMMLIGELRPVLTGDTAAPEPVPFSTAFVLASLVLWGAPVAIVLQAVSVLVSELVAGKPLWKLAFNVGQYVLAMGAAAAVLALGGMAPTPTAPTTTLDLADLPWLTAAMLTYHLTNLALVAGLAGTAGQRFWESFTEDFWYYTFTFFAVAALMPIVVVIAAGPWALLPLLLLPMAAVWKTAAISRDKEHQAFHDSLTDLPNRALLQHRLEQALDDARRTGGGAALLLLDLDRFKEVNDTLGHAVGDRLLEVVARRALGVVRPSDTVARLGGDEFAVVLPGVVDAFEAVEVAGRVRATLADPVHLGGHLVDVDVSVGVAVFPQHGDDAETLMRCADVAMYVAKGERTGIEVYRAARDPNSARRLGSAAAFRTALENGRIELHHQPAVSLRTGEVVAMEALARWRDPGRGWVPPEEFLDLAERAGLTDELTRRVLAAALAVTAERWNHGLAVPATVNVSLRDVTHGDLAGLVVAQLDAHGLPPEALVLEVTESVVVHDPARAVEVLRDLADVGVACWLDDFGLGYSSLVLLEQLPVTGLKIDRTFVRRLDRADGDPAMVRSIVGLAHGLGLTVVAEGVQTAAAHAALRELGADAAQGWHLARPMPREAAQRWLVARSMATPAAGPSLRVVGQGLSVAP